MKKTISLIAVTVMLLAVIFLQLVRPYLLSQVQPSMVMKLILVPVVQVVLLIGLGKIQPVRETHWTYFLHIRRKPPVQNMALSNARPNIVINI